MKKIFEKTYELRPGDFDKFNLIRPASILELFQDVAGRHAEEINTGYNAMQEKGYFWVLVKIKFRILSQPVNYQKLVVKTWPLVPNKFVYRREYSIESENGTKLIEGSSEWVVVSSVNRRLVSAPDLYPFADGFHTEMNFEAKLEKIEDIEIAGESYVVRPGFSELDTNNHVNNTKYANFVMDALHPEEPLEIDVFSIEYRKEVTMGTPIEIYLKNNADYVVAKGLNDSGDTMFACKIEYKK